MSESFYVAFTTFVMLCALTMPQVVTSVCENDKLTKTWERTAVTIIAMLIMLGMSAICYFIGHWLYRTFGL